MFLFKRKKAPVTISSFITGSIVDLASVPDEVFSTKAMGDGFAMLAADTIVKSPVNGTVTLLFPTNHAIGIELENGVQILIHIGLDSATFKAENFTPAIAVGSKVSVGDTLVEMIPSMIEEPLYIMCLIMENPKSLSYSFSNINTDAEAGKEVVTFK